MIQLFIKLFTLTHALIQDESSVVELPCFITMVPSLWDMCCKKKGHLHKVAQWRVWAQSLLPVSSHWNSQWAHFEDIQLPQSGLTRWAHIVSLLWAFCEFPTLTVSSLLPLLGELIWMISQITHNKLMVWVANPQKAHSKQAVWSHLVSSLWAN